jgi:hypothetical protein
MYQDKSGNPVVNAENVHSSIVVLLLLKPMVCSEAAFLRVILGSVTFFQRKVDFLAQRTVTTYVDLLKPMLLISY